MNRPLRALTILLLAPVLALASAEEAGPRFRVDPTRPPAEWVLRPSPVRSPAQSIATFDLPDGFRAEVVASEPIVRDPIAIAFAPDGRIWVVEYPAYNWKYRDAMDLPEEPAPPGRVVTLEDTTGDGRMDRRTVFLDDLEGPRALSLVADGLLVGMPPEVWFYRDTTGDGRADEAERVLDDYGPLTTIHAMPNGLLWAMDNWIYSTRFTARLRWADGEWQRDEPVVSRGQWGITQDNWGRLFYNTQADPLRGDLVRPAYWRRNPNLREPAGLNVRLAHDLTSIRPHAPTPGVNQRWDGFLGESGRLERFTSSGGPAIYRGQQFPAHIIGDAFVCVPAGNLVRHFALTERDGVIDADNAYEEREFLFAHDERFRPTHAYSGPDGALYIVDMYRGIIEGETWIDEITRDYILARNLHEPYHGLGRIYRIVHEDQPLGDWPAMHRQGPDQWVEHLAHPNGWWRDTAQRLLVEGGAAEVLPALRRLAADGEEPYTRIHALWTLEGAGALDVATVLRALADESFRVREAALRLAEPWLDDPEVLSAVLALADDEHVEVRRQLLFTLGETDAERAEDVMRRVLHRDGEAPWMAEAALSGLHNRELPFLERTLDNPAWREPPAGGERLVSLLARAVTNEGDPARLTRLVGLLTGDGWWRPAVLAGIEEGRTANLAAAPEAVRQMLDLPDADLRERAAKALAAAEAEPAQGTVDLDELDEPVRELYERGRSAFLLCAACHQPDARGIEGVAPPLVGSPWLDREPEAIIRITLHGLTGRDEYPPMAPLGSLDDDQLAAILTYLRLTHSTEGGPVHAADVQNARQSTAGRVAPWTPDELEQLD